MTDFFLELNSFSFVYCVPFTELLKNCSRELYVLKSYYLCNLICLFVYVISSAFTCRLARGGGRLAGDCGRARASRMESLPGIAFLDADLKAMLTRMNLRMNEIDLKLTFLVELLATRRPDQRFVLESQSQRQEE